jgi:serine/threonine protein kinase
MTPERYQRLCELFDQAKAATAEARAALLEQVGAGEPSLRAELERMLADDQRARDERLLQTPCLVNVRDLLPAVERPTAADAPPARPADTMVGREVGVYRVGDVVGQGGMGVVYQAEDTLLKRRVALKVLPRPAWGDDAALRRLLREAQVVARLSHPHVVPLYHVLPWEGGYCLVMEFMAGGSLQARLDRAAPLPWREATGATADACRGLEAAHAAGLVHRDVKPANLLCDAAGMVKVADFGLVRGAAVSTSGAAGLAGTLHYMSPEQCSAAPVDARSDVYALGATYFALLTGRPPYPGLTPAETLAAHCGAPVPDPRAHVPDLPEGCAAVVRKAMAKKPAERYQSAEAMLAALRGLTDHTRSTGEPTVPPARPRHPPRRLAGVLAGVALLAGLVWVGVLWWPGRREGANLGEDGPQPPPPVKAFGAELPASGRVLRLGGRVEAVAFAPDGKRLAAGVAGRLPGGSVAGGAVVWDVATGAEVCRRSPSHPILCLGFARDGGILMGSVGRCLSYYPDSGREEDWCRGTGVLRTLAFTHDGAVLAIGFSAGTSQGRVKRFNYGNDEIAILGVDGGPPVQQVVYAPHDHTLAVAHANGAVLLYHPGRPGSPVRVQAPRPGPPPALAFAPDRPALAVGSARTVRWWSLARGAWEEGGLETKDEVTALAYSTDGKHLAVAGAGPAVVLHQVATRRKVHTFRGHRGAVLALACHPDGAILASGSADGDVRVWDLRAAIGATPSPSPPSS